MKMKAVQNNGNTEPNSRKSTPVKSKMDLKPNLRHHGYSSDKVVKKTRLNGDNDINMLRSEIGGSQKKAFNKGYDHDDMEIFRSDDEVESDKHLDSNATPQKNFFSS